MQVALKRIPDVLSSPDLTKKVLREVCILRRLSHPFIISLRDAFLRPSSTGGLSLLPVTPLLNDRWPNVETMTCVRRNSRQ